MTEELEDLFRYLTNYMDHVEGAVIRTDDGSEWHITWSKGCCNITQTKQYSL